MSASPRRDLLLVLAVALALRLVAQAELGSAPDSFAPIIDAEAYLLQSLRVSAGHDVADGVYFQAPLYPLVAGALLAAGGLDGPADATTLTEVPPPVRERAAGLMRGLNLVLGLLAVALIWRLGCVVAGPRAGLWAGLLTAAYAPFVFYEYHLLKVSLSLVFLPWAVLAAARAAHRGRVADWAWVGVALATGGLVQGHLHPLVLAAAASLVVLPLPGRDRRFGARAAAAVLIGAALAMSPVIVRNSLVAGRLVLSTAQGGAALYLCNNPDNPYGIAEHQDNIRQVPRFERDDFHRETEALTGLEMTAAEVSAYWSGQALDYVTGSPGAWLATEWNKLLALVSRHESADNTGLFLGEEASAVVRWSPSRFGVILPLALGGLLLLWRGRRSGGAERPVAVTAMLVGLVAYAGVALLFCITARYRMPMVPLLLVPAGVLLARLGAVMTGGGGSAGKLAVGACLAVGLVAVLAAESGAGPFSPEELARQRSVRLVNRGLVAFERGDLPAARRDLEQAIALTPGAVRAYVKLARVDLMEADARAAAGDLDAARSLGQLGVTHMRQAQALNSSNPATWKELGLLAYQLGHDELAAQALERAVDLAGHDRESRQYYALALLSAASTDASSGADDPRLETAAAVAQSLADERPGDDDGWALLTLARTRQGRLDAARAALERYDQAVAARVSAGGQRLVPEQPGFAALRDTP